MVNDQPVRVRSPRRDGLRNREALLAAARAVFAEAGPGAPFNAVARRAGVGQASLYRHFPTRTALVLALFEQSTRRIELTAQALGERPETFAELLGILVRGALEDFGLLGLVENSAPSDALAPLADRLMAAFTGPLAVAQREGLVDPGLRVQDVLLILRLLEATVAWSEPADRVAAAERTLWLIGGGTRFPPIRLVPEQVVPEQVVPEQPIGGQLRSSAGPSAGTEGRRRE